MNERKEFYIALLIVLTSLAWGIGVRQGDRRMKKWQDSYYHAHDLSGHWLYPCPFSEGCVMISTSRYSELINVVPVLPKGPPISNITPATPPKKAKPAKAKRHELTCKDIGGCAVVVPGQDLRINCASNFDCNKRGDIDPQGSAPCIVGQEKNRAQDVCCPAYLEVNDCSWHHGTNPRESAKP